MQAVRAFVRLGRPLFLGGGFVLYALGAAIAAAHGHAIDLARYLGGQLVVAVFQLMTHYANDYYDYDTDRANTTPTAWSGGSRVLVDGRLPRRTALSAARVLGLAGGAAALPLVVSAPRVLPIVLAIGFLAWAYSAPPLRLCGRGAGELATAIVVTGLVPLLAFSLQASDGRGVETLVAAIAPLGCLQIAMLLAVELPDAAGDAATGKRTLVVQLGARRATQLYTALVVAAYLGFALGAVTVLPASLALAAAAGLPFAAWHLRDIHIHDLSSAAHAPWDRIAFCSVALLVGTAAAELAATLAR